MDSAVHVYNHESRENITHVYRWDNAPGAFSPNLIYEPTPYKLFDEPADINDILYIGVAYAKGYIYGEYYNLIFDIGQVGDFAVQWQYWNGAWVNFALTYDGTTNFQTLKSNGITWYVPNAWIMTTINGVYGFWVRVTKLAAGTVQPVQANRGIYSCQTARVRIASADATGDIDSLLKTVLEFEGAYDYRVIMGSRLASRGADFSPYLNILPAGYAHKLPNILAASLTGTCNFNNLTVTANGSTIRWGEIGPTVEKDLFSVTISSPLSNQYTGKFRIFLCGWFNNLTSTIKIQCFMGASLNLIWLSKYITPSTPLYTTTMQAIDFGIINIPSFPSGYDVGDIVFKVRGITSGVSTVDFIYILLMPCDEFYFDSQGYVEMGGVAPTDAHLQIIDSVDPKFTASSTRLDKNDLLYTKYRLAMRGSHLIKGDNQAQDIWIFQYRGSGAYLTGFSSLAELNKVGLWRSNRYLGMRGDR